MYMKVVVSLLVSLFSESKLNFCPKVVEVINRRSKKIYFIKSRNDYTICKISINVEGKWLCKGIKHPLSPSHGLSNEMRRLFGLISYQSN